MKRQVLWAVLAGMGVAAQGCLLISVNKESPTRTQTQVVYVPTTMPAGLATAADLEARIQAANHITSFTSRDAALERIAVDAANAGQAGAAQQALGAMTSFTARDTAAETCAMAMSARGMTSDALSIAKSITSVTVRDRTIAKLATH